MRLTELNPEWADADPDRPWLKFDCPHCREPHARIEIPLHKGETEGSHVWGWNGERDFDKITITPSINFEKHWHGFIRNGEVTNA